MIINSPIKIALLSLLLLSLLLPLGILFPVSSLIFLLFFFLHLIPLCFSSISACNKLFQLSRNTSRSIRILFLSVVLLTVIAAIAQIILPVTAKDALIHHLAIPKLWIKADSIYPTPWHVWSFYPMVIQLSFTALLQIGPEQLCSVYIFLFLPLAALCATKIATHLTADKDAQILSSILLLLIPAIIKLSGIPLVDLPLVFFCGAGLYYLLALQNRINTKSNCFYAGIAWGLALSCKLNAFPAFIFALLIFGSASFGLYKNKREIVWQYFLILSIALLCFSPWLIKNWFWASNPFYPYAASIFGQHVPTFNSGLTGLNPLQQRLLLYRESPLNVILLPIRIFIEGQDENPRLFDGKLSFLLLGGLILGIFKRKDSKYLQLAFYSVAFILFALVSMSTRVRYLTPAFISLSVLGGCALGSLRSKKMTFKLLANIALALQFVLSFQYVLNNFPLADAYAYTTGSLSKTQYLESNIPEYPIVEFCNSELPEDSKISLIYTGNQFYLYQRQVFSAGHTSADQILAWLHSSKSLGDLAEQVKNSGLTHFIIEDSRLQAVMQTALSQTEKEIWNSFRISFLSPVFSARGFTVYKIL